MSASGNGRRVVKSVTFFDDLAPYFHKGGPVINTLGIAVVMGFGHSNIISDDTHNSELEFLDLRTTADKYETSVRV